MDNYLPSLMRNRVSKEVLHNIKRLKKAFSQKLLIAKIKKQRYMCNFAKDNRREFVFGVREEYAYDEKLYDGCGEED